MTQWQSQDFFANFMHKKAHKSTEKARQSYRRALSTILKGKVLK
jgi:heme-degrading monooxygenase HmoA